MIQVHGVYTVCGGGGGEEKSGVPGHWFQTQTQSGRRGPDSSWGPGIHTWIPTDRSGGGGYRPGLIGLTVPGIYRYTQVTTVIWILQVAETGVFVCYLEVVWWFVCLSPVTGAICTCHLSYLCVSHLYRPHPLTGKLSKPHTGRWFITQSTWT